MSNLFETKIKLIYKDRKDEEHQVVRRVWEKKDKNGHYYVTAIKMSYLGGGFNISIEHIHDGIIPLEWTFVDKEFDYVRREAVRANL